MIYQHFINGSHPVSEQEEKKVIFFILLHLPHKPFKTKEKFVEN
jgi:hypothetical protein